jgi:hypothetical protein
VSTRVDNVWNGPQALVPLVTGGQGTKIYQAAISQGHSPAFAHAAENQALNAFVHGVQGAMLVGAVLAFSAAMTAFFGLRHAPAVNPAHDAVAVEA